MTAGILIHPRQADYVSDACFSSSCLRRITKAKKVLFREKGRKLVLETMALTVTSHGQLECLPVLMRLEMALRFSFQLLDVVDASAMLGHL